MTKKDLIKGILKLGEELNNSSGINNVMIINDMEILVDKYTSGKRKN